MPSPTQPRRRLWLYSGNIKSNLSHFWPDTASATWRGALQLRILLISFLLLTDSNLFWNDPGVFIHQCTHLVITFLNTAQYRQSSWSPVPPFDKMVMGDCCIIHVYYWILLYCSCPVVVVLFMSWWLLYCSCPGSCVVFFIPCIGNCCIVHVLVIYYHVLSVVLSQLQMDMC